MAVIHDSQGRGIDQNNPLNVTIAGSTATGGSLGVTTSDILPIDIQSHLASTIQTHNAVSVSATTGTSDSPMIDTDGFTEIGITVMKDAGTSSLIHVYWSNDGVSNQGAIYNALNTTDNLQSLTVPTRARYFKLRLANTDAVAHTFSAWAYLKA
jgi:hypothetical protein